MTTHKLITRVVWVNAVVVALPWLAFALLPASVTGSKLTTAAVLAVVAIPLILLVRLMLRIKPLPAGLTAEQARARAVGAFNVAYMTSTAMVVLYAMISALVTLETENPLGYLVPFALAEVILLRGLLPSPAAIEAARARLESAGTVSHLEEGLQMGGDGGREAGG